ncbi:conjugal transfer protein TraG N-terminal domain-containing protein [Vibrio coralliilyticus]|uniref:conjugal transfer protein TraG N-terminal domain-containing protein n=1 Tax=Vibrio coralliilyticus TaxID=190893 RepID=UPI001EE74D2A|nr:conjugal transfer protein TraG N-terminal domain-containing protein [Vibrio coralliilyticus]
MAKRIHRALSVSGRPSTSAFAASLEYAKSCGRISVIDLDYYTYTQGATLARVLNAVAAFFDSSPFADLLAIALMFGTVMTLQRFMVSRHPQHLWRWGIMFALVPTLLIKQTARVWVHDLTAAHPPYAVDNVPYLIALPTWAFSTLMVGVADGVETAFNTTDDRRYGRTGMLFGSMLYRLSQHATLPTIEAQSQWQAFFNNCVVDDIEVSRKYTWDALYRSVDILGLLDATALSPVRGQFDQQGHFHTCLEIYPTIRDEFDRSAKTALRSLSLQLYGPEANAKQAHLSQALSNSYLAFLGISDHAVSLLRQNLAINAVRLGIDRLDSTAGGLAYAYTQNQLHQTTMGWSIGLQAQEYLPMLHALMFFVFSGCGFFVAAAALIPTLTHSVLSQYCRVYLYLAMWPTLFALINALMLWTLETYSPLATQGLLGLSLSNADGLSALHTRFGAATGVLMLSVPVLASKLLRGGVSAIEAVHHQFASMIHATNTRASAASATGNLDFGQVHMQTHQYNTTHANKWDDNVLLRSGVASMQDAQGAMTQTYLHDDLRHTYDARETESKPLWQSQAQRTLQRSVQSQFQEAKHQQAQWQEQLSAAYQQSAQWHDRWSDQAALTRSYGHSEHSANEGQVLRSSNTMATAISGVADTMGWTRQQATAFATAVTAHAGMSVPSSLGALTGISAGVNAQWNAEQRHQYQTMTGRQRQALTQALTQYQQGASEMAKAGLQLNSQTQHSALEQYARDFSLHYQRLQGLTQSATQTDTQVESLSKMDQWLSSDGNTLTSSTISGFQRYLERQPNRPEGWVQRLMTARLPEALREVEHHFDAYLRSEDFRQTLAAAPLNEQASAPSFTEQQRARLTAQSEQAQQRVDEVRAEAFTLLEGQSLFSEHTHHQVEVNATVWGGELQRQSGLKRQGETPDDSSD